ncbi:MAG: DUF4129 domain-containing protein [Deltaproteobacteria bacterium]
MRRSLSTLALVAMLTTSTSAFAGSPLWGYFVRDADGELVTAGWPKSKSIVFGSDEDADVRLDGLSPEHATVVAADGAIRIEPEVDGVLIDGRAIDEAVTVHAGSTVTMGAYTVQFSLVRADYEPEPTEEEPPPDEDAEEPLPKKLAPPPPAREAGARASLWRAEEFDREAYRFCHDPEFGEGGVVDADLCGIIDESSRDVCPAALESCPWEEYVGRPMFGRFGGGDGSRQGTNGSDGTARPRKKRKKITVPLLPPEIAYTLLAIIVAILVFVFAKSLKDAGWERSEIDLAEDEIDEAALDLQSLPEARSHVLLKLSERALARGDREEAAILLHLAVLRHLDDEGLAQYHPSKTNGDYLRSIRRHKPLAALFRGVANETERVRFGDGLVDENRLRELIAEGRALLVPNSQPPAPFAGAATLALLAAMSVTLQGCPQQDEDSRAFYSHAPAGMSALVPTLRAAGLHPKVLLEPLTEVPLDVDVIVFRTSASRTGKIPKDLVVDAILDQGISLVVIDDLGTAKHFLPNTSTVGPIREELAPVELTLPIGPNASECQQRLRPASMLLENDRVVIPDGHRIAWTGEAGYAPIAQDRFELEPLVRTKNSTTALVGPAFTAHRERSAGALSGCMYVFSDRDLFTNASLTRRENARFVGTFFGSIAGNTGHVWFADRLDRWLTSGGGGGGGSAPKNPVKPLAASNMLPLLVQGLVSLGLLYVFLGAAFGPLRDRETRQHKAFVEHVEAIGRQYARCGKPGLTHAATALARLVVMRNRERVRGDGGWAAVAHELSEKHDLPEGDVRAALRLGIEGKSELGAPRHDDPEPASERMLQTLSRLLGGRRAELAKKPKRSFRKDMKS